MTHIKMLHNLISGMRLLRGWTSTVCQIWYQITLVEEIAIWDSKIQCSTAEEVKWDLEVLFLRDRYIQETGCQLTEDLVVDPIQEVHLDLGLDLDQDLGHVQILQEDVFEGLEEAGESIYFLKFFATAIK